MVLPPTLHVQRFFAQARSAAFGAARVAAVPAQEHAHVQFVLLRFEEVEELPDAIDLLVAFEHQVLLVFGQIAERHVEADAPCGLLAEIAPAIPCPWAWSTARPRLR